MTLFLTPQNPQDSDPISDADSDPIYIHPVDLSEDEIHWLVSTVRYVLNDPCTREVAAMALRPIAHKLQAALPVY